MKTQYLAVIFIIIILPITMVISYYTKNEVKTLDMQISYDNKLKNSTYDAIKAYELNAANSDTSDLANSKMRDIEASANTFFNSLSSNFNLSGYKQSTLKEYVPALVYTMYDGLYIYSKYTNELSGTNVQDTAKYYQGTSEYGLQPYVFYSCRYQYNGMDFVITYSLDNYITIQGKDENGDEINKSGYLLSGATDSTGGSYMIRGEKIAINREVGNTQYIFNKDLTDAENINHPEYPERKVNGIRYYLEGDNVFSMLNDKKLSTKQRDISGNYYSVNVQNNNNAQLYYKQAYEISDFVKKKLGDLKTSDAVEIDESRYSNLNY